MRRTALILMMLSLGGTLAAAAEEGKRPRIRSYNAVNRDTGRDSTAFNCNHPIIEGGTRYCPPGQFPRKIENARDFDEVFTKEGGD